MDIVFAPFFLVESGLQKREDNVFPSRSYSQFAFLYVQKMVVDDCTITALVSRETTRLLNDSGVYMKWCMNVLKYGCTHFECYQEAK